MKTVNKGFTLVEIAIVLVIVGLLLGGILKGQELINSAKVRALVDRQSSMKVSWFAFQDRFRALPGDWNRANAYISGSGSGDGNGLIDIQESPLVYQHLTGAGFLRCSVCTASESGGPGINNSLVNNFGGVMGVFHAAGTYGGFGSNGNGGNQLVSHTGARVPSNLLADADRKSDDGIANTGEFRVSSFDGGAANTDTVKDAKFSGDTQVNCASSTETKQTAVGANLNLTTPMFWRPTADQQPIYADCGAAVFI